MAKDWIAGSIPSSHKGKFKAKAKRAGMSTRAYAEKEKGAKGTLGKEAREALTLMDMHGQSHAERMYGSK